MNIRKLEHLLKAVKSGETSIDEAKAQLKSLPFEDLGFARIDHHRVLRKGFPEVIWGEGKTSDQILSIMRQLKDKGHHILITRLDEKKARVIRKVFRKSQYYPQSRVLTLIDHPVEHNRERNHPGHYGGDDGYSRGGRGGRDSPTDGKPG